MGASLNKNRGSSNKAVVTSFKILVVGACHSGKTSIIRRYTTNRFIKNYDATRLLELTTHTLRVPGRCLMPISVTFWEVPSNPLPSMKEKYYSNADGVIVVVDVSATNPNFLQDAISWKEDVSSLCSSSSCDQLPFLLLVNRLDKSGLTEMAIGELKEGSEENGFVTCVEVFPHHGGESVFSAVNGLLRLLVDKGRLYEKDSFYPTAPSQTSLTASSVSLDHMVPLDVQLTGEQEQDRLIAMCWKEVDYVHRCDAALSKGLANFEKESLHENFITKKDTIIEHCIAGLRERLPSSCELHVAQTEAGRSRPGSSESKAVFPQLKITDKCLFKCKHEVLKLLYIYHTEIYPPGNHILHDIRVVQGHIQRCKESLLKLQQSEEEEAAQAGVTNSAAVVKVEAWERDMQAVLKRVKMLAQKIQVAALWNSGITVSAGAGNNVQTFWF